jgi:TPR repeat protein
VARKVASRANVEAPRYSLPHHLHVEASRYSLGCCYSFGEGVTVDTSEAFRLYQMAANAGHSGAKYNLGRCYEDGEGVDADIFAAVGLYQEASLAGYADAQYNLGCCYDIGSGVAEDKIEAARLFALAAEGDACAVQAAQGDPAAESVVTDRA